MDEERYFDWRGNEIKVGSEVIYVVVHSSSCSIVEGHVMAIVPVDYKTNWGNKKRKYKLEIQPTKRNHSGWITTDDEKIQTITAVERVTVIG